MRQSSLGVFTFRSHSLQDLVQNRRLVGQVAGVEGRQARHGLVQGR